ncbi:oligosaccharide flippase family protein [Nocardioides zeae]
MGAPGAAPAVRLLALCVLVNGIVATAAALLQRDLRQDLRLVVDQVNLWLGAVVALVLAAVGTGATSLAVGRVTGAVVSGVLLLGFSPLPLRFGWDPALLRRLLRFGLPLAGASAVVVGIGFVDQLLVGHHVGPASLGAYVLAANLAGWPVHLLSGPLRQVTPPLFARRRHDPPAARAALGSVARALLALAVPCCVALAACAGPVVHLLYGEEWVAAAGPLRWLALGALVRIVAELLYDYLVVVGRTSWLLAVQVAWLVALAPAVAVGLRIDGISGAAAATAVVGLLVVLPSYALALRAVRTPVRPLLGAVVLPGAAGLAVVVAVRLPGVAGGPDLLVLGVAAAATALAWSLLVARGHLRMPAEVPPGLPPGLPAGMPAEAPRPAATAEATP